MNISICQPYYDHDLSRYRFDENFFKMTHIDGYYQYIDYGNEKVISLLNVSNYNFTKKQIVDGLLSYNRCDIDWLKQDIKDTLYIPYHKCKKSDLLEYMQTTLYSKNEIIQFMVDNLNPSFEIMPINGYSQGDRVYIVVSHRLLNECSFINYDYLQKLIYDSVIYCKVEIEECEFYHSEYMDEYEYNKDEFIDCIMCTINEFYSKDDLEYIKNYLNDNLSNEADYY